MAGVAPAFFDLPVATPALAVVERTGLGIATIMARAGHGPEAIAAAIGFPSPSRRSTPKKEECRPRSVSHKGLTLVGTGPGQWLAVQQDAAPEWAEALAYRLSGIASVADQSGGYAVLGIGGSEARSLLSRGAYIDLHPDAFGPGTAATTMIAHIGVTFWQIDDAPRYELAVFRSYATSFSHWLTTAAANLT